MHIHLSEVAVLDKEKVNSPCLSDMVAKKNPAKTKDKASGNDCNKLAKKEYTVKPNDKAGKNG